MKPSVLSGNMIYRKLEESGGLQETQASFSSLEELFMLALNAKDPYLLDRISITGLDPQGHRRVVSFVFQSITVTEESNKQ